MFASRLFMMEPQVAWMSPVVRQPSADTAPLATHSPHVLALLQDDTYISIVLLVLASQKFRALRNRIQEVF